MGCSHLSWIIVRIRNVIYREHFCCRSFLKWIFSFCAESRHWLDNSNRIILEFEIRLDTPRIRTYHICVRICIQVMNHFFLKWGGLGGLYKLITVCYFSSTEIKVLNLYVPKMQASTKQYYTYMCQAPCHMLSLYHFI